MIRQVHGRIVHKCIYTHTHTHTHTRYTVRGQAFFFFFFFHLEPFRKESFPLKIQSWRNVYQDYINIT